VVHFPATAASALPSILKRAGDLPVRRADNGEPIVRGTVYVASPNCHLLIQDDRVRVTRAPRENGHRPAVDTLFRSAAASAGPRVIGIVLSGNLNDGTLGLRRIKERGGVTVVQAPTDAVYPGMPSSAIEHACIDHVVAVRDLPALLVRLVGEPAPDGIEPDVVREEAMEPGRHEIESEREVALEDRWVQPGTPSTQTCPECHGTLWEDIDGGVTSFRCRIGHSFTAESLVAVQAEELEAALWTALRALEEHAALVRRMAARAAAQHHRRTSSTFTEQALDSEHHAAVIRNVLENLKLLDLFGDPAAPAQERAS
jgi:two-component system chemotaxis response regulator CheB